MHEEWMKHHFVQLYIIKKYWWKSDHSPTLFYSLWSGEFVIVIVIVLLLWSNTQVGEGGRFYFIRCYITDITSDVIEKSYATYSSQTRAREKWLQGTSGCLSWRVGRRRKNLTVHDQKGVLKRNGAYRCQAVSFLDRQPNYLLFSSYV